MGLSLTDRTRSARYSDAVSDTLSAAFARVAASTPEKPFLHFEGETYSYAEVQGLVAVAAGHLHAWGLREGERVALYLGNSPSFVLSYLAVLWLGGTVVPVNTRYRAGELRHMLEDSGARLLLHDAAGRAEVERARDEGASLEQVLELGLSPADDLRAWAELAPGEPLREPRPLSPDALAVIGYTSGTTGRSKGAMLTHGNFLSNSRALTEAWRWRADDHLLLVLPLFHMHGLGVGLHGTLLQGSTITLRRGFEAEAVFERLLGGDISLFFGVPTMHTRLLEVAKKRGEKPSGLRLLVSGSAPLSPQTHGEIETHLGLRVLERYGMTETVMNLGNPYAGERRAGSVGVPFKGVEVRIANEAGVLPPGERGEIQLRGPNIFRGYWGRPDATAEAWTEDGWFKTGDLGYVDEDGYHYISGRAKELIISGGFNVYPREVEEVLAEVEGVREVAVLGLSDEDLGERVVAAVVGDVAAEALLEHCRERIAGFKKPRDVYFVGALPRNALGKVQKHLLKDSLERQA